MARRPTRPRAKRAPRRKVNGKTKPTKLRIDLTRWLDGAEEKMRLRFVSVVLRAHSMIVERSPVDTGFFRASWGFSINEAPPPATIPRPEGWSSGAGAGDAVAMMTARVGRLQLGDICWVYNPVIYGPALEHGHSQQAPRGMVALTLQDIRSQLQRGR